MGKPSRSMPLLLVPPGHASAQAVAARGGMSMLGTVDPARHGHGGDRTEAFLAQTEDGSVLVGIDEAAMCEGMAWHSGGAIPFENARTCPVSAPGGLNVPAKHENIRVGVVVLIVDADGNVLLTRRPRHMR